MFDVEEFVASCLAAVRSEGDRGVLAVKDVLERAVSEPTAIEVTLGPADQMDLFTTWHNSDELTVLHVVWPPDVDLYAHDHEMWAAIGLYGGREDNYLWRVNPDGSLAPSGEKTLRSGDSIALGRETIHSVANPTREWTGAIHCYGGDYFAPARRLWKSNDEPAIPFDVRDVSDVLTSAAARARPDG